jgi:IS5 family transposase
MGGKPPCFTARDARWLKKNGISYFGYKNHISVDVKYGFLRHYVVTDASVHDSQVFSQLIDIDGTEIWGDIAKQVKVGI